MSQDTPFLCIQFLLLLFQASYTSSGNTTHLKVNVSSSPPSVPLTPLPPLTKDLRRGPINSTTMELVDYMLYDKREDEWIPIPNTGIVPEHLWIYGGNVKILIHGYNSRPRRVPMQVMESMMIIGKEYAKKNRSLNIIAVNWTPLATKPVLEYPAAAANVHDVGIAVAIYLRRLRGQRAFASWKKLHLIGFSLGAHVAGIAGQEILKLTSGRKIGRITGLDPAGPEFDGKDNYKILDKSDARYVDIIHCNMGPFTSINYVAAALVGTYGSSVDAGHADFYPNGGERQSFQCGEIEDRTGCSHNTCSLYFALSLREKLAACPCTNWSFYVLRLCPCSTGKNGKAEYMGDRSNRRGTARGKYYLSISTKVTKQYFRH